MFEHDWSPQIMMGTAMRNQRIAAQNAAIAEAQARRANDYQAAYLKRGKVLAGWQVGIWRVRRRTTG
jgi:hypothetical protein